MTINWVEITEESLEHYESAMKLYDQAFPIEVREPHQTFLRGLQYTKRPNNYHFLVGLKGNQLASFATGHYFAKINAGFIVYIVTNPEIRNKGLGSKTLLKIEELLNKDALLAGNSTMKAIFLETETPEMVHTEKEKQDCLKRYQFFSRNGYEKCDEIPYLQPALHDEMGDIPLDLFIKNLDINKRSKDEIKNAIVTIYKEKYQLVNGIDKSIIDNCLKKMEIEDEE
ncbi:GNAT family N-acetyltransferase [Metabacillus litoralis]|uniref:GNAT family N-acetyltransferase n=1 Tax=Metabacillus litoralis TaxID=152268 RepID=UPI000EF6293E|nr:GNAT family N-acetyltransferase [Metabacillus litoralis]MCM3163210.1 GNAT family N-acetyltransferase [Metabacillus litoralis]MCM3409623.1 GNAT family N-acetyltransferase [Metabacillus litoralis]